MRLKQNSRTAIVVKKSWANLAAIQVFLHEHPHNGNGSATPGSDFICNGKKSLSARNGHGDAHALPASQQSSDDGHTVFARVLDDTDARGLWIELNTKEHEQNASVQLQALMIPWTEVLAVVVANKFAAMEKAADIEELNPASAPR